MEQDIAIYLTKAMESLLTAETEFINGRYNSCANRCYSWAVSIATQTPIRRRLRTKRDESQERQAALACQLLNRMLDLDRPQSYLVLGERCS